MTDPVHGALPTGRLLLLSAGVLLVVAGFRLHLIGRLGTDLPFWDQWDAEWRFLYRPHFDGTLSVSHFLAPHNEHRVLFTRLLSLGLVLANGQWDARLQMVVNSVLYAGAGAGIFFLLGRRLRPLFCLVWALLLSALLALPFAWENTLAGFQSQFYFLAVFSLGAIWLLANARTWSLAWWAGVGLAVSALFTMASGVMAAVAVAVGTVLVLLRDRSDLRTALQAALPTIAACALIAAAGAALTVRVELHAGYQAKSVAQYLQALVSCLAWPLPYKVWSVLNWLPFALFSLSYLSGRGRDGRSRRFVLFAGIWVLLQIGAVSYSRATVVFNSRYFDIYSYGILVNFFSLLFLLPERAGSWRGPAALVFFLAWAPANLYSLYRIGSNGSPESRGFVYQVERFNVSGYLATGGRQFVTPKRRLEIPYPDPAVFAGYLDDPRMGPLLPAGVRRPAKAEEISGLPLPPPGTGRRIAPPYPWERLWRVEPAGSGGGTSFRGDGSPYLFFYLSGSPEALAVTGSGGEMLPVSLVAGGEGEWREAYVRGAGRVARFQSSGRGSAIFSQPKEMGRLSLWALLLARNGLFLAGAGTLFAAVAAGMLLLRPHKRTIQFPAGVSR